jgi:pilus assembly protein CpaB
MRLIAILVLAFGAALAAGAIYFASEYFEKYQMSQAPRGPELVSVIAAKTEIPYGTKLEADKHLRWVKIAKDTAPEGVFTEADDLIGPKGERGTPDYTRYALRSFARNEVILASRVTGFGEEQRMAMRLGEGRRAFTIRIDAVSGVAGFVTPGDRVDIMLTRGGGDQLESVVILESILVIAVDQQTNNRSNNPVLGRTATVEVTPNEAQKLALAQQVGNLSLTLRGYSDPVTAARAPDDKPDAVNLRDLLGEKEREVRPSITVRKGGAVSEQVEID